VVSSLPAAEKFTGREIESRLGIGRVAVFLGKKDVSSFSFSLFRFAFPIFKKNFPFLIEGRI
jgi:hypothetical protein